MAGLSRVATIVLAAGVALMRPGPTSADPPPSPELVSELVGQLQSANPRDRIAASERALGAPDLSLRQIESALRRPDLPPEARRRLLAAARARFASEPRAALGISSSATEGAVVLTEVHAGFPAHGSLRPGDRIDVIDGERIRGLPDLRRVIIAGSPGDPVTIRVTRNGEPVTIQTELGSFEALNIRQPGFGRVDVSPYLPEAWAYRSRDYADLGSEAQAPIVITFAPADWGHPSDEVTTIRRVKVAQEWSLAEPQSIVLGGEPDGLLQPVLRLGEQLPGAQGRGRAFAPNTTRAELIEIRTRISEAIGMLSESVANLEARAVNPDLPPAIQAQSRAMALQQRALMDEYRARLFEIDAELQRLNALGPAPAGPRVIPRP